MPGVHGGRIRDVHGTAAGRPALDGGAVNEANELRAVMLIDIVRPYNNILRSWLNELVVTIMGYA